MCNHLITNKIDQCIARIALTADSYPGAVIIHDIRDWSVAWMCNRALQKLGVTADEIKGMSAEEYHKLYFNPEDAKDYVPKLFELLERNNNEETVTYFQQVRYHAHENWIWHMSSTKVLLRDDNGQAVLAITISFPIDAMHHMANKASRLLEENNFLRKNFSRYSKLSKRECEVLRLLAMGQTSADTAAQLFLSVNTIETHRKNIRQKLEVSSYYELCQYARAFDLI